MALRAKDFGCRAETVLRGRIFQKSGLFLFLRENAALFETRKDVVNKKRLKAERTMRYNR